MSKQDLLRKLPSVDEVLKRAHGTAWLARYPRRYVTEGIRMAIEEKRRAILDGDEMHITLDGAGGMAEAMERHIRDLSSLSLRPVINATGIVIHTNLGRSALSEHAIENVARVARGYSNLEYDLAEGQRGKRYTHIRRLLRQITGAEDGIAVNNNAAAVLLCLSALARGREVIVSRGELVEIGGSFRIPEVMEQSGARLVEVGATNKTHPRDYEGAITENTALLLKVHQSNYRMAGFTSDVSIAELREIGRERGVPVMYDMGSGNLVDLKPYGIHTEPTVQEVIAQGADLVTFSGDKLLGGPQAGMIVGTSKCVAGLMSHPLLRALRIDKLTLAALESTLWQYADMDAAKRAIPTVRMLLEPAEEVGKRARRLARMIARNASVGLSAKVAEDVTYSGGGAMPTNEVRTFVVAVESPRMSANQMEEALRTGEPPIVARIKDGRLLLDARTLAGDDLKAVAARVRTF